MADILTSARTKIRVRDLPLLADIGIDPDEIGRRQPLIITVELTLSRNAADSINGTIDYRRVARAAETLAEVHIPLIETFARRLGTEYLAWPLVEAAYVSIDKPFALTRGVAGVEVTLTRRDDAAASPIPATTD